MMENNKPIKKVTIFNYNSWTCDKYTKSSHRKLVVIKA